MEAKLLIMGAYLIVGLFTGAIAKYAWPTEFEGDEGLLIPIGIMWPIIIFGFIIYTIGKGLHMVLNGLVAMIGITVDAYKTGSKIKLPRVRWKD